MNNELTKQLQDGVANDTAHGNYTSTYIGEMLLGTALTTTVYLEFLVARDTAEKMFRGWDGVLTPAEATMSSYTAVIFCIVTLAAFHVGLRPFRKTPSRKWAMRILIGAAIITISQPIIGLLTDMRTGNSLDQQAGSVSLQNWLLTAGYITRSIVIVMAAVTATFGLNKIASAFRGIRLGRERAANAQTRVETIYEIDEGYQDVDDLRDAAVARNHDEAGQLARGLAEGFKARARALTLYVSEVRDPLVSPQLWMAELVDQFRAPFPASDPEITQAVKDRLDDHSIDFESLPDDPRMLMASTRALLADHAAQLRRFANFDTIYFATAYRKDYSNA